MSSRRDGADAGSPRRAGYRGGLAIELRRRERPREGLSFPTSRWYRWFPDSRGVDRVPPLAADAGAGPCGAVGAGLC